MVQSTNGCPFKMIAPRWIWFSLILVTLWSVLPELAESSNKQSLESATCKLLNDNIVALNPWTLHPIIFEPIRKGRLTIWTGVSSIPTSEFKCFASQNPNNRSILIEFSDYANKLEWSFEDLNRGTTHFGNSVSHVDGVRYKLTIKNDQYESYLECNKVKDVELLNPDDSVGNIITSCSDCSPQTVPLIDAQIKELIKTRLNDHITEKLFWDVNQLVYSHHFSNQVSIHD